jgi:glycosyltransferase involved in cell wall biosynthesis
MNKGISVIVCCYNSAERLPETIRHIALQKIDDTILWELIIVNNASTDNTETIAKVEWEKYTELKTTFSIVYEAQHGLTCARKKGVSVAQYEYVLFCDDDNWLRNDYLQNAFNIMESNPRIGALGGQSEAVSDIDFPDWFEDFKSGYVIGQQAPKSGDISYRGYLWGAGMMIRLNLLINVFDPKYPMLLVDRKGTELSSGGDSEIAERILLMGYRLFYSEDLYFKHFIPANRLIWNYKKKMFKGFDQAWSKLNKYYFANQYIHISRFNLLKNILKLNLKNILCLLFNRDRKNVQYHLFWANALFLKNSKFLIDADSKIIFQFYLKYGNCQIRNKKYDTI